MRKGLIALLPLAAMLAGCWYSSGELISYYDADTPKVAGSYTLTVPGEAPKTVRIAAAENRYYTMASTDSDGAPSTDELRFDRLSGSWYLVHSYGGGDGGSENYYYRIVRISNRSIEEFDPACDESDTQFTGVDNDAGDCVFTDYEGLHDAALVRVGKYETGDTGSMSLVGTYTK